MNIFRNSVNFCRITSCQRLRLERMLVRKYANKKRAKKVCATTKALGHFDDFYGGLFQRKWNSIRLGLLSTPKHVVLLNNFSNIEETKESLTNQGALDLRVLIAPDDEDIVNNEYYVKQINDPDDEGSDDEVSGDDHDENNLRILTPYKSKENFSHILKDYKVDHDSKDNSDYDELNISQLEDSPISLHESLRKSDIDTSRFIDPSSGVDLSALQEFVPVSKLRGEDDKIPEADYYRFYKAHSEIPVNKEYENEIIIPEHLHVFSFPRGDTSRFPEPEHGYSKGLNYYPLDGASILPVLALGLEYGDRVLDMCAAPGGKALAILQTLMPEHLLCNEPSISRSNRLRNVFRQYLCDSHCEASEIFSIRNGGGEEITINNFDKILVDVPCTCDRLSATVDENNIFKGSRIKERLMLPALQSELLSTALRIVKPGGTVVYSTCTLSPIQNDGVVNLALHRLWKEHNMEFSVRDLSLPLNKMSSFYRFATDIGLKYGSLVVPFLPVNFGPTYFCKLVKNKL